MTNLRKSYRAPKDLSIEELQTIESQFVEQIEYLSGELALIQKAIQRLQSQIELIEPRPQ